VSAFFLRKCLLHLQIGGFVYGAAATPTSVNEFVAIFRNPMAGNGVIRCVPKAARNCMRQKLLAISIAVRIIAGTNGPALVAADSAFREELARKILRGILRFVGL
jgi:hypothetical protein